MLTGRESKRGQESTCVSIPGKDMMPVRMSRVRRATGERPPVSRSGNGRPGRNPADKEVVLCQVIYARFLRCG